MKFSKRLSVVVPVALLGIACYLICTPGCNSKGGDVSALRLPDSVQTRQPLSSAPERIPSTKKSAPVSQGDNTINQNTSGAQGPVSGVSTIGAVGRRWWDNRTIFFVDHVQGTGDLVLEAVKGQPYFPETRIFIYATDKSMEGTYTYDKIKLTMESTELDDRIFIWVHFDDDRKPLFVKKLVSDNIKDKIADAPLRIE